jgi:hypothetical protein
MCRVQRRSGLQLNNVEYGVGKGADYPETEDEQEGKEVNLGIED